LAAAMLGVESSGSSSFSPGNNPSGILVNDAVYNPDGIEMVYVEGNDTLADFYIGKYEVTRAQWQAIMGNNPLWSNTPDSPADMVSWNDAQAFIIRLNARTGRNYRLPTEAEWKYAAREGKNNSEYLYSGSDDHHAVASWYPVFGEPKPVGQKLPNALGIYDMSGSVEEWCQDWYDTKFKHKVYMTGVYLVTKSGKTSKWNRKKQKPSDGFRSNGIRLVMSK
jgi:formylglycine-generating enzyme required for sulfatase activity